MLIAKVQINHKNVITRKGEPFICDDEKVISKLKTMKAISKKRESTKVKSVKKKVVVDTKDKSED